VLCCAVLLYCYTGVIEDDSTSQNILGAADIVDPPKHITVRNVIAVFERLGFDTIGGQKIFAALFTALQTRMVVAG